MSLSRQVWFPVNKGGVRAAVRYLVSRKDLEITERSLRGVPGYSIVALANEHRQKEVK